MWYFWLDQRRGGKDLPPDDRTMKVHVSQEKLGGDATPIETACGRKTTIGKCCFLGSRAIRQIKKRGGVCKTCFPMIEAERVANILAGDGLDD